MVLTPFSYLQKLNIIPCPNNKGTFFWKHNNYKTYLCLIADDILFASENKILKEIFEQKISEFFTYQVQKESMLKYMNWQIIQIKHGISIDQTSFLQREILQPYWKNTDHKNIYPRQNPFTMEKN